MDKLLKDAIADAKAVRETALTNAKLALEEAFRPRLQSMLSNKLRQEVEGEEDEELEDETMYAEDEELNAEEIPFEDEEEVTEEEEFDLEDEDEVPAEDEEVTEDEEIDFDFEDEDEAPTEDEEEIVFDEEMDYEGEEEMDYEDEEEMPTESKLVVRNLMKQLREYRKTVKILQSRLNEVNLVNTKMAAISKLFGKGNYSSTTKMRIIETFDKANTQNEVNLVYAAMKQSLPSKATVAKKNKVKKITEGLASKQSGSSKPKSKIITEVNSQVSRFQQLAKIKK